MGNIRYWSKKWNFLVFEKVIRDSAHCYYGDHKMILISAEKMNDEDSPDTVHYLVVVDKYENSVHICINYTRVEYEDIEFDMEVINGE